MSAECGKCGFDIVYPEGTWPPVGVCLNCQQADRIEVLEAALREARNWIAEDDPGAEADTAGYFDALMTRLDRALASNQESSRP